MRIYSIFNSINGEVNHRGQGSWVTFIRLAGCNLRCKYCDTQYAQGKDSGEEMTVPEVIEKIDLQNVLITGGEPLWQMKDFRKLCWELVAQGYDVSVETNGTLLIPTEFTYPFNPSLTFSIVNWIVDYKLPGAGLADELFKWKNIEYLRNRDFIKFVITDDNDYNTAKDIIREVRRRNTLVNLAFSPIMSDHHVIGQMGPNQLYEKMMLDGLFDVHLNFQLHKLVKLEEPW